MPRGRNAKRARRVGRARARAGKAVPLEVLSAQWRETMGPLAEDFLVDAVTEDDRLAR